MVRFDVKRADEAYPGAVVSRWHALDLELGGDGVAGPTRSGAEAPSPGGSSPVPRRGSSSGWVEAEGLSRRSQVPDEWPVPLVVGGP